MSKGWGIFVLDKNMGVSKSLFIYLRNVHQSPFTVFLSFYVAIVTLKQFRVENRHYQYIKTVVREK